MFFILSKVLLFLFSPLSWVICILLWALLTKRPKRRRNLLLTSFLLLYLFSNSFLFDEAMRAWETRPPKSSNVKVYDYAIVLGGILSYYDKDHDLVGFNRSVDRLMQAIKLYQSGKVKKIVFTGGDSSILSGDYREADIIKQYLSDIGIPDSALIFENESRNTHENATFVYKILKPATTDKLLLITSGFHMKRSLGCFQKAGMNPDYYVADLYSGKRKYTPDHLLVPDTSTLDRWSMLFHEISGYLIYKIMGYC